MAKKPDLPELTQVGPTAVEFRGRRLVYFGGSDYFRLSWNRDVRGAVQRAVQQWGHNVAAGRTTTGNHPVYGELEQAVARLFRFPAAVVTATGYAAPMAVAQSLGDRFTQVVLADSAHGCLHDAARLTGLPVLGFSGRDVADLNAVLSSARRPDRPIVFTNGLAPLEGTLAPLRAWLDLLPAEGGLLVDDAHGLGTLGAGGRGALGSIRDRRVILTGTLSKALGAYGGFALGPRWLREQMVADSRIFLGGTPLPPPLAAGALAALKLLDQHGSRWRSELEERVRFVRQIFAHHDPLRFRAIGPAFTLPVETGRPDLLERRLLEVGIYPSKIRYAQGPSDRFYRFAVSTAHTWEQLERLKKAIGETLHGSRLITAEAQSSKLKAQKGRVHAAQAPNPKTKRNRKLPRSSAGSTDVHLPADSSLASLLLGRVGPEDSR